MAISRRLVLGGLAAASVAVTLKPAFAATGPLIRVGLNENPWGPSPKVAEAIKATIGSVNRYVGEDADALVQQIAVLENVDPSQVLLGEVLAPLGLNLALEGGRSSRFVYSAPGYAGLTDAAAAVGGSIVGVPLNAELENDLPALAAAIDADTRALFIVNPHNPSGTVSDDASFTAFLRAASARTVVIVDEAYLEYTNDFKGRTAARLVREGANVVVFRTFAKIYGLAGLQIGYALAPVELAKRLRAKGVGAAHSLDRLSIAAASAALSDQARVVDIRDRVARERSLWHGDLDGLGWTYSRSETNFVFFKGRLPQVDIAKALKADGIEIGRPFAPLTEWTRISIGTAEENLQVRSAIKKLA